MHIAPVQFLLAGVAPILIGSAVFSFTAMYVRRRFARKRWRKREVKLANDDITAQKWGWGSLVVMSIRLQACSKYTSSLVIKDGRRSQCKTLQSLNEKWDYETSREGTQHPGKPNSAALACYLLGGLPHYFLFNWYRRSKIGAKDCTRRRWKPV